MTSRKKISPQAVTSSNSSSSPNPSRPISAKTGNSTESNTGKKKTRDAPISASNYAPGRKPTTGLRAKAAGVSGSPHGENDLSNTREQQSPPIVTAIPKDPSPDPSTTLTRRTPMKPLHPNRGVVPFPAPPVRRSPARRRGVVRRQASRRRTTQGPLRGPIILVAVAATRAVVSDGGRLGRCWPMRAHKSLA